MFRTARALVGPDVDRLWIYQKRGRGLDADLRQIPLPPCPPDEDEGLPGRVARTRVPIVCHNVHTNPSFRKYYRPAFPDTQAQWCFPLIAEECALESDTPPVFCLESTTPGGIDPKLRRRVELVTMIAGLKIAGLRGERRLERIATAQDEAERWQLEQQILELSGTRPEPAIRKLFDALADVFQPQGISLWQYDETEDNLCHPVFSSGSPRTYRDFPRPGPWGAIGRVLKDGNPLFYQDIGKAPRELQESRFMSELRVRATAYLPGGHSGSQDATRAKGILFVNYEAEHRFGGLEREVLRRAADAAVEVLQLRSLARRHRLAQHFDLGDDFAYPGASPSSRPAARAVLNAFVPHLDCQLGVLYVRDRPGSVYVRYEQTGPEGNEFKGRYLESHPLVKHLRKLQRHAVLQGPDAETVAGAPACLREGQILVLPLRRGEELLGFCQFGRLVASSRGADDAVLALCRQALETLLDLDNQARSKRRHISLLAQFLRIYEYAARETSPVPLLTAFLDALLEGSTADACSIYLLERQDSLRLAVARGDARPATEPTDFEEVMRGREPRFDSPGQTSHPDVRARVVLPLRYHERPFGVLSVEYHVDHIFTVEDQWFFRVLVHQLGQSLNYFAGNRILLERVSSLAATGAHIARLGSPEFREDVPVFSESRKLAILAKEYSGADFVDLFVLVEGDRFLLQATDGGAAKSKRRVGRLVWRPHRGLGAWVVHNQEPILVADVLSERSRELGYVVNPAFPDAHSELIVPVLDNRQVIAIIDLNSWRPGAFNEGDSHFVQAIAAQAVTLLRTAELQRVRKQLREERDLLVRINSIAQEALGQGQTVVLDRILQELAKHVKASFLSIHLLSRDGYSFDPILSVATPPAPELLRGLNVDNSILGRAVQELRADPGKDYLLIEDIVQKLPPGYPPPRRPGIEPRMAELVVPLGLGPDIVGVINLEHPDPAFLKTHLDLVKAVVKGIRNALALADDANRRAGRELRQRMVEEADEFLQLLTSTVFHDAPQLVKALELHLDVLDKARATKGGDALMELADAFDRLRGDLRSNLGRLDRLSATLPSYRRPDRVDIAEIVRQSFEETALPALTYYRQVHCQVAVEVPPEPLYVFESASWVRHILENLAINAFRAMAEHATQGPMLRVSAETAADGRLVLVRVADNGPGMPPEIAAMLGRERIPHEKQEQLGIFHRLARKHVQRNGGDLELVRNEPGRGCTFELRYPNHSAPPEEGVT